MQGTKNLTEGVISRQLFNLAMPIMGTSFIQMAYSITDMAWVGRLGSEAVAAIGAVGILTWMTNSISYLNKVGSEVSVGQSIGAQNVEDARGFASQPNDRLDPLALLGILAIRSRSSDYRLLQTGGTDRVERRGIFENRRFRIPIYLPLGGVYRDS